VQERARLTGPGGSIRNVPGVALQRLGKRAAALIEES